MIAWQTKIKHAIYNKPMFFWMSENQTLSKLDIVSIKILRIIKMSDFIDELELPHFEIRFWKTGEYLLA